MADEEVVPEYRADGETVLRVPALLRVVTEPAKETPGPVWMKTLEQAVALIKAVVWPLLVVLLLILYHRPLDEVAALLPGVVAQAQKISVGGLSMEIQVQAKRTGGSALAEVLNELEPGDIEELIHTGRRSPWGLIGSGMTPAEWFLPSEAEMAKLKRLEALLEVIEDRKSPSDGTKERISFDEFAARLRVSGAKQVDSGTPAESRRFELPRVPPSEEIMRLRSTEYQLTKLGKDAFESILNAITAQLSQGKKAGAGGAK